MKAILGHVSTVHCLGAVGALILSLGCNAVAAGQRSSVHLESSGEGRNGPNTSGLSIPAGADRSFEPSELQAAMTKCSVRLARAIYQQVAKESPDKMIPDDSFREDEPSVRSIVVADNWIHKTAQDGQPLYQSVDFYGFWHNARGAKFQLRIDNCGDRYPVNGDPFTGNARIQVVYNCPSGGQCGQSAYRTFSLPKGFAQYAFEHSVTDLVYNEYGDLVSFKAAATNLHIKTPSESGTALPLYRMIGDTVGGVTAITVDSVEFQNCLQGELQN